MKISWPTEQCTLTVIMITLFLFYSDIYNKINGVAMTTEFKINGSKSALNAFLTKITNCKSMFTINADGKFNSMNIHVMEAIRKLMNARQGNNTSYLETIKNLGKFLTKTNHINFKDPLSTDMSNLLANVNEDHFTQWPYVPCEAHKYSPKEVKTCVNTHQTQIHRPFRISFVGDSMVRTIMKGLVMFLKKDLHLSYINDKTHMDIQSEFEKTNFKSNVTLIGPHIELRFYWASYLDRNRNQNDATNQGAKDLLRNWVEGINLDQDPFPDILYIGSGTWLASMSQDLYAIDEFLVMIEKTFNMLKSLALNTVVLWHVHPTTGKRESLTLGKYSPEIHDIMNQAAFLKMKGSNIWFWDTLAVLSSREKKDCSLYMWMRHLLPKAWACKDPIHPGVVGIHGGVNMILNLACNHILNIKGKCCS